MLSAYDRNNNIVHQDDDSRFTKSSTDVKLITTVSSEPEKPVWVSCDVAQQKRRPVERKALSDSGMNVVFFRSGFNSQAFRLQAIKIITVWDAIVDACARVREPTVFEVSAKLHADKVEEYCKTKNL